MKISTVCVWVVAASVFLFGLNIWQRVVHAGSSQPVVRVGHFPNLTHAQAVIGRASGWFEQRVGPIEWKHFNAGPSAMEALLAGALDLVYVGSSPAINVFLRSHGEAIRVVAGATNGGASLVVRKGAGIAKPEDFHGKRVAAPEVGNTQDVALRYWLKSYGLRPKAQGGDVDVLAVKNADILALFQRGTLDAAWVPEPWASRLIHEGGGVLFLDERTLWPEGQFPTVILVARTAFLREHRDVVVRFVGAHRELTAWIRQHPDEARTALNQGLAKWLGQPLPEEILREAFGRMAFDDDPAISAFIVSAQRAWGLGYLPGDKAPDLDGLFDLSVFTASSAPVLVGGERQLGGR